MMISYSDTHSISRYGFKADSRYEMFYRELENYEDSEYTMSTSNDIGDRLRSSFFEKKELSEDEYLELLSIKEYYFV